MGGARRSSNQPPFVSGGHLSSVPTDLPKDAAPERLLAAAILPLQNMDFALEELQRVARIPSVRAVFIRPMFLEDRYLNHPYYDPLWAELERLGITAAVHATPGLWNPEWTLARPIFRKDQRPARTADRPGRRRRAVRRRQRRRWPDNDIHGRDAAWSSAGTDPGQLARQPHVRRLDSDRLHSHGALPGDEGRQRGPTIRR